MYILTIFMVIAAAVLTMVLNCSFAGVRLAYLVDMPSLLLILLIVIPVLLGAGVFKDVNSAFRMLLTKKWDVTLHELKRAEYGLKVLAGTVLAAGCFETVCSLVIVLGFGSQEEMSRESLFANLEVSCLPLLYALLLFIILIPLKAVVRHHILDFMERDL